jgi:hypothetical protein
MNKKAKIVASCWSSFTVILTMHGHTNVKFLKWIRLAEDKELDGLFRTLMNLLVQIKVTEV